MPSSRGKSEGSLEYHGAHLAFSAAGIVEAAARREPIFDKLRQHTVDAEAAALARFRDAVLHTDGPLTAALDVVHGEGQWTEHDADDMGEAILAALDAFEESGR
jgi:hypothetical protein